MVDGESGNQAADRAVVVLMCGIAGSGKTTYARELERRGYVRLSIDEKIWARFGGDATGPTAEEYERYRSAAEQALRSELVQLIRAGRPVVVDSSFWQRAARDRCKELIESHGCRWELIYLKADRATLRRRLRLRNETSGANSATISDELLDHHIADFEEPVGEGERVFPQYRPQH